MRMTGCPNGCARPWLAEVAFVGKAYGAYNMYLGGGYHGQRLNKLYRSSIKEEEILGIMKPLMKRYALERNEGERFGDFVVRIGMIKPTTEGRDFHQDVSVSASRCCLVDVMLTLPCRLLSSRRTSDLAHYFRQHLLALHSPSLAYGAVFVWRALRIRHSVYILNNTSKAIRLMNSTNSTASVAVPF